MVRGAFLTVLILPPFSSISKIDFRRACGLKLVSKSSTWFRKSAWSVFPREPSHTATKLVLADRKYVLYLFAPAAYSGICPSLPPVSR